MSDIPIPRGFEQSLSVLSEAGRKELMEALESEVPTSLRINDRKWPYSMPGQKVNWSGQGYYLPERPIFNSDPLWHAGAYYVQEASSMIIGSVAKGLRAKFDRAIKGLDLCASPGGKSTDLASVLSDDDILVSNEVISSRVRPLQENVLRWGKLNHFITNKDARYFKDHPGTFDLMVIDAPCSGEGMFRKDHKARQEWSQDLVKLCHARQVRILKDAWPALNEGGFLIYSTCTFNEIENEQTISTFLQEHDAEIVNFEFERDWSLVEADTGFFRMFPHLCKGEGFSFCVLKKLRAEEVPKWRRTSQEKAKSREIYGLNLLEIGGKLFPASQDLIVQLDVLSPGMELGSFKKEKFIPSHRLAMLSHEAVEINCHQSALSYSQSMQFLRKETFDLAGERGFTLLKYKDQSLGWINHLGNRFNNLYPTNMRVLTRAVYNEDPNILI